MDLATAVRRQPGRPTLFDYVSPARLNTWLFCPLKFKIRYVDGVREPASANLFLGRRVHHGLEFYYRGLGDGHIVAIQDVVDHVASSWEEAVANEGILFGAAVDEEALKRQALGLVKAYLDRHRSDGERPVAVELPLECPLVDPVSGDDLGIVFFGRVDLVLESRNGPVIVDFKTAARSSPPLEIAHEVQLTCYAYAFRTLFGQDESQLQIRSLIKTKVPKVATHRFPARDGSHFRRLFAVIHAYLADLRAGRFVYRPSWTCSMCDFRETHCLAWRG